MDGGGQLDLNRLEAASLPVVRRGFDRVSVATLLRQAAAEIRRLRTQADALRRRADELEAAPQPELEAERIAEALGQEAVRVLEAARAAAAERAGRAEQERGRMIEQARADGAQIVEESRAQGRDIVAEARSVRKQILGDLVRKRQSYRIELEQLRAAGDRLLESLAGLRREIDDSAVRLVQSVPEAQAAAERVGLLLTGPEPTPEQVEAEITEIEDALSEVSEVRPWAEAPERPGPADDGAVLYDVEAEDDAGPEDEDPFDGESSEPAGVGDIFARLRSAPAAEAAATPDDPADGDNRSAAPASDDPADGGTRSAAPASDDPAGRGGEDEPVPDESGKGAEEPAPDGSGKGAGDEKGSPSEAARSAAAGEIARALKQKVVDEQGELLDALRRDGTQALTEMLADEEAAAAFAALAPGPLENYASDIDVKTSELDVGAAAAAIEESLVTPMRNRLREALDRTDDADELSEIARAVYRESRTRLAPLAAEECLAAADRARSPAAS